MKKIFLTMLFASITATAQVGETTQNIGSISIKSKKALIYDSRNQKSDTIYIAIKRWNYDQFNYLAEVVDYRKIDSLNYEVINHKFKSFSKETVNYLFGQISPLVPTSLNYSDFLNALLTNGLLIDTQTNLIGDKTVYGGDITDWE